MVSSPTSKSDLLFSLNPSPFLSPDLALFNHLYELRYPLLRYVTFVAGRPRSAIATELSNVLTPILHLVPSEMRVDPSKPDRSNLDFELPEESVMTVGSEEWQKELDRALSALWDIANDRAGKIQG